MSLRRKSRELALQCLYQIDQSGNRECAIDDLKVHFDVNAKAASYAQELVSGIQLHLSEVDSVIEKYAKNWRLNRMAVIDRNLLRIATYEFLYKSDIPGSVIIDEAIEIAKSESPNAILLDVKMPGINGIETCRILRAQEETKLIPVIMATALGITKPEATDAGADDIIYKPFNLADLALRVKSILCIGDLRDRAQRLMTYMEQLDKNCPE